MKKVYSSFEEIDRDLEILKLERRLHYYKIKQRIENTKEDLTLPNMVSKLMGVSYEHKYSLLSIALKGSAPLILRYILKKILKRK